MTMNSIHSQTQELQDGLVALGISLTDAQVAQLLTYQDLIAKWNKVYNLTAVRLPDEMLRHHLLDSLAALPPLQRHLTTLGAGARLLDVGSGAGLPGVVFAICCPALQVTCVDTVGKKTAFIQQAASTLKLTNLKAVNARVETLKGGDFDVVCSRAFASLVDFTSWSQAALAPTGVWFAMKGKHPVDELAVLPAHIDVFHVEPLTVPGLDAERCLLWLRAK
jgi:16S rRNA (guanine527-N7)-methyltransferase